MAATVRISSEQLYLGQEGEKPESSKQDITDKRGWGWGGESDHLVMDRS